MKFEKVNKKVSGRACTKYKGLNLRLLEIEALDAIEN